MSQPIDPTAESAVEQLMSVDGHTIDENRVVTVAGEVDMMTTPELGARLRQELAGAPALLVVDLSKVQFLGSSGLAVLVETGDSAAERGLRLRLVCSSREVLRPLEATGLTELFDIYPDLDAALGS